MSTVGQEFSVEVPAAVRRGSKTGYRSRVAAHPVAAFFLLAYGFSWLFWLAPAFGLRGPAGAVLLYVGVFGPAVAAATITRLTGGSLRAWLREVMRFRAAPRWYATVIGFPILLVAALTVAFVATGGALESSLLGERLASYVPLLIVWTLAGVGEEPGWRGFALPRLQQRLTPVRATLVLGLAWALWHLPLLAAADEPSHGLAAAPLVGVSLLFIAAIVGYAFFYTYLWNRTRSIWLAILLHGSITAANGAFVLMPSDEQVGGTYAHLQVLTTAVVVVFAVALVWATHRRLGQVVRSTAVEDQSKEQDSPPRNGRGPDGLAPGAGRRTTPRSCSAVRRWLATIWSDRRIGVAIAVVVAAAWGLLAGWWTPRGPITNGEGLSTMAISLVVGALAGLATRSRWAMLLAPAVFAVVFELVRLGTDGPTVDGIHASTYGLFAFAVGRGIHGLLALVPMVLGGALGAGLARRVTYGPVVRRGRARAGLYARRGVVALVAAGLVLLAVAVARPASTDPILGSDGEPLAGSVAELTRVEIGGRQQAIMIRGHSTENPVLLFLAGGPGGTELGAMRRHLDALEQDFVVVTWDQRGAGKSYAALDPTSTLTLDRAVSDSIEVTNYLRDRFDERKIYLVGQSWGTILGVLAVQRQPELYRAFVGTGQMVSPLETDRVFYRDTLQWARDTGQGDLVDTLTDIGAPPYESILDNEPALSYEHEVYPYDHSRNSEGEGGFSENLFVEEYTLLEQIHNLGGFLDTFSVLYPQIQDIDFRDDASELDVPVYLVQGRHEAPGRAELANEWFERLQAPAKKMIVLDTSGHRPLFEQPDRFHEVMTQTVLAQTTADRP